MVIDLFPNRGRLFQTRGIQLINFYHLLKFLIKLFLLLHATGQHYVKCHLTAVNLFDVKSTDPWGGASFLEDEFL